MCMCLARWAHAEAHTYNILNVACKFTKQNQKSWLSHIKPHNRRERISSATYTEQERERESVTFGGPLQVRHAPYSKHSQLCVCCITLSFIQYVLKCTFRVQQCGIHPAKTEIDAEIVLLSKLNTHNHTFAHMQDELPGDAIMK